MQKLIRDSKDFTFYIFQVFNLPMSKKNKKNYPMKHFMVTIYVNCDYELLYHELDANFVN